ncbi:hypothetical protein [Sulfolobus sp. S-194]|nr:hypothetical protein [Sulfolobus sp. S-194]
MRTNVRVSKKFIVYSPKGIAEALNIKKENEPSLSINDNKNNL